MNFIMQLENKFTKGQKPLPWIDMAFTYYGLKEIKGPKHEPKIQSMLTDLNLPWKDDETPWCAVFVSAMLTRNGRGYPAKSPAWARSYDTNGLKLDRPAFGATATKARKGGGGHVFFIVGKTSDGMICGLGGNQNDSVNIALFKPSEITSINWPPAKDGTKLGPTAARYDLPVYDRSELSASNIKLSYSEA